MKAMESNQVTIYVEAIDVKRWALFQEHYDPFTVMVDAGVFGIKNGNAVLHFDNLGVLQTIERGDILYSKRHLSPQALA